MSYHTYIFTFPMQVFNEPLYFRCRSYIHEQIVLSHAYICIDWSDQRQRHPITWFVT